MALLGKRDSPTDAVEEYCRYLAEALVEHGIELETMHVDWAEKGWETALSDLQASAAKDRPSWFLLQYTALAWSRRGFSWRVLNVIRLLKKTGARVAAVFHDARPYFGNRVVDRLRRRVQLHTMRKMLRLCDISILTVPAETTPWGAGLLDRAVFIPIAANLPSPESAWTKPATDAGRPPTVGVFSLSGGRAGAEEANLIADNAAFVSERLGALRVVVAGRNAEAAGRILREKLQGKPVELVVHGLLPGGEIVSLLAGCDAMLFVRGPISTRRGSAMAGIACGLPVIARDGWETAPPVTEAGVVLVPPDATHEFGPALLRVLQDSNYRAQLAARSRNAQSQHFSWPVIAARYARILAAHQSDQPS